MPRTSIKQELELSTRGFTKVKADIMLAVDGKELPSMEVLGKALEKAVNVIQEEITNSYKVVPPRTDTPMADPYAPKPAGSLT